MDRNELQRELKLKEKRSFLDRYIRPVIASGLVEMTIPTKPQSRLQKYRLTEAGKALLKELEVGH